MKKANSRLICEIVRQLGSGEIDHDKAALIAEHRLQLPSGPSIREGQARRLYEVHKFGDILGCTSFAQYLDAEGRDSFEPVPQIPAFPHEHVRLFGVQNIWLIDGRVAEKVGIKEYCKLIGLAYHGESDTLEAYDPKRAKSGIRWMLGQDGIRNRNRKANDCRNGFQPFEVGMDWVEGGGVYALDPTVIEDHYLDLPGSVPYWDRGFVACLGRFSGKPEFRWPFGGLADPHRGAASRSE